MENNRSYSLLCAESIDQVHLVTTVPLCSCELLMYGLCCLAWLSRFFPLWHLTLACTFPNKCIWTLISPAIVQTTLSVMVATIRAVVCTPYQVLKPTRLAARILLTQIYEELNLHQCFQHLLAIHSKAFSPHYANDFPPLSISMIDFAVLFFTCIEHLFSLYTDISTNSIPVPPLLTTSTWKQT